MHFNFACVAACMFAATALAVPVVERKVVVVRADVCPAPPPSTVATPGPEITTESQAPPPPPTMIPAPGHEAPSPPAHYHPHPPPPGTAPAPAPTVSNTPPASQNSGVDNKQCGAGTSVHCCNTVDSTDNSNVLNQLTAAGIDHNEAQQKGQVGLTCE